MASPSNYGVGIAPPLPLQWHPNCLFPFFFWYGVVAGSPSSLPLVQSITTWDLLSLRIPCTNPPIYQSNWSHQCSAPTEALWILPQPPCSSSQRERELTGRRFPRLGPLLFNWNSSSPTASFFGSWSSPSLNHCYLSLKWTSSDLNYKS